MVIQTSWCQVWIAEIWICICGCFIHPKQYRKQLMSWKSKLGHPNQDLDTYHSIGIDYPKPDLGVQNWKYYTVKDSENKTRNQIP